MSCGRLRRARPTRTNSDIADHLVVADLVRANIGREAALDRMRAALMRFLDHHGVDKKKYSETITVFWIEKVAEKLNELGPERLAG